MECHQLHVACCGVWRQAEAEAAARKAAEDAAAAAAAAAADVTRVRGLLQVGG